jgi:two-component system sensor histidine kinase YesM
MTISVIAYQVSSQSIKKLTADYSGYLIGQIGLNIDKRMNELEEYVFIHYKSSNIMTLIPSGQDLPEGENPYVISSGVLSFMDEFLYSRPFITSVMIKHHLGQTEFIRRPGSTDRLEDMLKEFDESRIKDKRGQVMWLSGGNGRIYMQRAMYNVESSAYIGLISVGIDSNYFREFYSGTEQLNGGIFIMLNENNEMLIQEDPVLHGAVRYLVDQSLLGRESGSFELAYEGQKYLFTLQSFTGGKWKLLNMIAVSDLTKPAEAMKYGIIVACLLSLLLAFFLAFYLSKGITGNVKLLLASMKSVSEGLFDPIIVTRSRDEIGQLAHRFNMMTQKVNELITVVYREKLLKEQAEVKSLQFEYKALQAQMNPHFLYNTLESIQSLAVLNGQTRISEMVYLLGSLLRESIRDKSELIPLHEEVLYVQHYLAIQQMMYEDQMEVLYELDETVMQLMVPKFILQPIVENAIMHGIEKTGKGIVSIRCLAKQDGSIVLVVEDNGVGMDAATVESLFDTDRRIEADGSGKHTRVGINSVNKRVRILYGPDYGVTISSLVVVGTTITIRLPQITVNGGTQP